MPIHLWEYHDPRIDRCSLCNSRTGPFVFEDRFTGKDFAWQRWPYCASCWSLIHQPPGADPELIGVDANRKE